MGPIGGLLDLIPGMGGAAKEAQAAVERGDMKRVEAIIQSMTVAERRDPDVLSGSRKRRVARGSGTSLQDVNRLLKQFAEMKKLMRQLGGAGGRRGHAAVRPAPIGPSAVRQTRVWMGPSQAQ